MKNSFLALFLGLATFGGQAAPFQNLDFERVNTNRLTWLDRDQAYGARGPIEDLLPGWQLSYSVAGITQVFSQVGYNHHIFTDQAGFAGLYTRENYRSLGVGSVTLRGGYIFVMHFWHFPKGTYTLTQRGNIPEGTSRIFLETDGGVAKISLNGTYVGDNAGDISAFAGQTNVELSLTFYIPQSFGIDVFACLSRIWFIMAKPDQPWLQIYYIGGQPELRAIGTPAVDYVIETSANETRDWSPFASFKSQGIDYFFIPNDQVLNRFFRAMKAP